MPFLKEETFSSWGEFLECAKQPSKTSYNQSVANGTDFTNGVSFDGALTMAQTGWLDAADKAKTLTDNLVDKVVQLIELPQLVYDVEGIDFDLSRVLDGEPEAWYRFETKTVQGEGTDLIHIVINCSVSGGVNCDAIIRRGAMIVALIELLEYAGKKVTVSMIGVFGSNRDKDKYEGYSYQVTLRRAGMPLDVPFLMFAVAHPASFRRLGFRLAERHRDVMREIGACYGHPVNVPKDKQGDIYFPCVHLSRDLEAYKEPEQFILDTLKTHGIDVKVS